MFPDFLKALALGILSPVTRVLVKRRVHPNVLTTLGFLVTLGAALAFFLGRVRLGGFIVLAAGAFDILDGKVARETGLASKFGSFYDSTLDRISELVIYASLLSVYLESPYPWVVYVTFAAAGGALMVSYTRARAEALGIPCKIGLMQRPERVVGLGVGAMLGIEALVVVLSLLAVLSTFTAVERIFAVYGVARAVPLDGPIPAERLAGRKPHTVSERD
ncbi:MAG: CDP-alcohol phosphatidyltransferase family protein [Gemmatimonadetes bacterium]|nr:CDP-alcohol phosphatidyltransferase family protein [Gemmatimonadota bacterium]